MHEFTSNVNEINTSGERQRWLGWIYNQNPTLAAYKSNTLNIMKLSDSQKTIAYKHYPKESR